MDADYEAVIAANREFYRAFADGDIEAMVRLWSRQSRVACIHPGWDALLDYHAVIDSWRDILRGPSPPKISCRDEMPYVYGDTGFVVCREVMEEGTLVATNVFVREEDQWRMVHHQAGPLALGEEPPPTEPPSRLH